MLTSVDVVQCNFYWSGSSLSITTLNATPGDDLSPTKWVVCKHLGSQWVLGLHVAMAHQEMSKTERNRKVQVSRTCQNVSPLRFKALMDLDLAVHASPGSHRGLRNATRNMHAKESYQRFCGEERGTQ